MQLLHLDELKRAGVKLPIQGNGSITKQLSKLGFTDLHEINGWHDKPDHPSSIFYNKHKDSFHEVFKYRGYHLAVSFEQRAFFETDSSG